MTHDPYDIYDTKGSYDKARADIKSFFSITPKVEADEDIQFYHPDTGWSLPLHTKTRAVTTMPFVDMATLLPVLNGQAKLLTISIHKDYKQGVLVSPGLVAKMLSDMNAES